MNLKFKKDDRVKGLDVFKQFGIGTILGYNHTMKRYIVLFDQRWPNGGPHSDFPSTQHLKRVK